MSSFDKSTKAIMISLTVCLGSKMIGVTLYNAEINDDDDIARKLMDTLTMISDTVVWAMMYYFVFTTQSVADLCQSSSVDIYLHKKKVTQKNKQFALILSSSMKALYQFVVIISFFFQDDPKLSSLYFNQLNKQSSFSDQHPFLFYLSVIARIIFLILYIMMTIVWTKLLVYFIEKKQQKLARNLKRYSWQNYLIIGWVAFLTLLHLYNQITLAVSGALLNLMTTDVETQFNLFFAFELYTFDTILTFLTAVSLLYLFYTQALKKNIMDRKTKVNLGKGPFPISPLQLRDNQSSLNTQNLQNLLLAPQTPKVQGKRDDTVISSIQNNDNELEIQPSIPIEDHSQNNVEYKLEKEVDRTIDDDDVSSIMTYESGNHIRAFFLEQISIYSKGKVTQF